MKKAGIAIICAAFIVIMGTGFAFAANAAHSAPMVPMVDSATGGGRTIAETFADYEDYGISYERKADGSDNMGNIYYNGQPVKTFIDEKNDGSFRIFSSANGGEITVSAVYDANGNLTGVKPHR